VAKAERLPPAMTRNSRPEAGQRSEHRDGRGLFGDGNVDVFHPVIDVEQFAGGPLESVDS
jgi:hypothetical protein